ncbi:MAG: hypothetical protein GWN99_02020 [Gemmatimonadetes bacterium]|uniref:Uncharacterized protein n=1 Tax=Candidatus Kutchimonas denitrificans TaxID=3056748 RepID=A0AAE5CA63_9BACT|nr:hypothetical protein [Gemmatimonadota bacterium]NIR74222.1 hypothetical protein [Candidatus Kutchimonas denitrificans]NIR99844.1 hypothetical protein [Gemmatimonadota bacterium]NIT65433.1 hypothetical protein [Gemmatimonadota bacterium]NIU51798.1 hypothetical protein [Gemmatimonadota bacterium]
MSRRHRLDARYARALGIALGISLAVHGAVLALGHLTVQKSGPESTPLVVVDIAEPQPIEDTSDRDTVEIGERPTVAAPTPRPPRTTPVELSEYQMVLARGPAARVASPLVPRPRTSPLVVQSGLTPIRIPTSHALASGGASDREGDSGVGIIFTAGPPGACSPGAGPYGALPNILVGRLQGSPLSLRP